MCDAWTVLSSRRLVDHPFLQVDEESVRLPDGSTIPDWPRVHARDYVNAVVLNEDDNALVLSGYKHGIGRSSWQILGGYLEPDEAPLSAARRELREETGCVARSWTALGSFVVDANRHVGVAHFFLARGARVITEPSSADLEDADLTWVSVDVLRDALTDGRVVGLGYATGIALALTRL